MHNVAGLYFTGLGIFLAFSASITFKKTIEKRKIGFDYEFPNPTKSEMEIKLSGRSDQQVHLILSKRKSYESPGTDVNREIYQNVAANSIIKHTLEGDYIYRIMLNGDRENCNIFKGRPNIEFSRMEDKQLSERYYQFFLTLIPIGVVIYYST